MKVVYILNKREIIIPKVFISYSWTSEEHEEWVHKLAQRLVADRVDVKLDKWDLQPGHDIYRFMEEMVQSEDIDKVLIICDKGYYEKAEKRQGGVGTETQIISPEVYSDVKQEKFIPIVVEKNEGLKPYIPTYIKSRMYIDLSSEECFEKEYERLLRLLYKRPEFRKPALGEAPNWLFEDDPVYFKTKNINQQLRDAVNRNPARVNGLINDFKNCFFECLDQFQIKEVVEPFDQQIVDKISDMLPLRNDYVEFLELYCSMQKEIDIAPIISIFEEVYRFTRAPHDMTNYTGMQFDHYKFIIHEVFIYTVVVMIENNQFTALGKMLKAEYFIKDKFNRSGHDNFKIFYSPHNVLNETRKNRLRLTVITVAGDIMINRANLSKYPVHKVVTADLILHYISALSKHGGAWFPMLYIYGNEYETIGTLQRLKSKRNFEIIKGLFMVETANELKHLLKDYQEFDGYRYQNAFAKVPSLFQHINHEDICSVY